MVDARQTCLDPSSVKVWTFILRGGQPFRLGLANKMGPALDHDGRRTIWKMMGTEAEAASVEAMASSSLIGARVERHTDEDEEVAFRHQGEP